MRWKPPPAGVRPAATAPGTPGRSLLIGGIVAFVVGRLLLPIIFIVGEAFFLGGGLHVRGSISAYYHTSMRDVFVAGLCVTGFLLATYRSGEPRKREFWVSLVSGVAVIFVVFFPTGRPGLQPGAAECGATPEPAGCSPVQQLLGEVPVATIHFGCALVFILSLAAICFVFAKHDGKKASMVQVICGVTIIAAVLGVIAGELIGVTFGEFTPLYLAEVVSVWAFAVSWLYESGRAWRELKAESN